MRKRKGSAWLPALFIFFLAIGFLIGYLIRGLVSKGHKPPGIHLKPAERKVAGNILPRPAPRGSPSLLKSPPAAPHAQPAQTPAKTGAALHPRIAVIIDDLGNNLDIAKQFMAVPFPLAMSVLPQLAESAETAKEALNAGKVVMLHIPLEALANNRFLGPGALLVNMDDSTLKKTIETDLNSVPGAVGLNNHMGSKASADPRVARALVDEAKAHRLFVIDSLTAPDSVLFSTAKSSGVPSNARAVFLDNDTSGEAIKKQMDELIADARKNGSAIAIGHPHLSTLKVLTETIPVYQKEGIEVVPVTDLVRE